MKSFQQQEEEYEDGDYSEGSYDEEAEGDANQREGQKPKHSRRSKNDNVGRTYQCGCGKSYLSYPALYTHIRTKHDGKQPEGTRNEITTSGRGRGRPRKIKPELHAGEVLNPMDLD